MSTHQDSNSPSPPVAAVLRWRKRQIQAVAIGVMAFIIALVGGSLQWVWMARSGVVVSCLCLIAIPVMGVLAARNAAKI